MNGLILMGVVHLFALQSHDAFCHAIEWRRAGNAIGIFEQLLPTRRNVKT
jgi:hypothetical protein